MIEVTFGFNIDWSLWRINAGIFRSDTEENSIASNALHLNFVFFYIQLTVFNTFN